MDTDFINLHNRFNFTLFCEVNLNPKGPTFGFTDRPSDIQTKELYAWPALQLGLKRESTDTSIKTLLFVLAVQNFFFKYYNLQSLN